MKGKKAATNRETPKSTRRSCLKRLGLLGSSISIGVTGLSGISVAEIADPGDSNVHHRNQEIDLIDELYYDKGLLDSGSELYFIDAFWGADKWHYAYRTEACASYVHYKPSTGEKTKALMGDANEGITIEELDAPCDVSTVIQGNADWGIGVQTPTNYGYDWQDAAIDSLVTIVSYFNDAVGALTSANEIVNYWDKVDKPQGDNCSTIQHTWDFWGTKSWEARPSELSHYVRYEHSFPPAEEMDEEYIDAWVTNSLNNSLTDFDNYDHTFGVSMHVNSSPDTMSTSEKKTYGIEKVPARKSAAAMSSGLSLDPNDPIYVARNPDVKITHVND